MTDAEKRLADAMREQHDIVACAKRYRWLRAQALDARLGLEEFVAMEQLDHIGDASKIDAAIDAAMREGSEATTAEQKARDMLERIGVEDAQSFSAGDLVELANLIAEVEHLRARQDSERRAKTPPPH